MSEQALTYDLNYGALDPTKVNAQELGRSTAGNLAYFGYNEVPWSRGESVYLMEGADIYLGFIVEGLGTKNLITDVMWHALGKQLYDKVGYDAVMMIVNDMITLGVLPMVIGQYLAVGSDRFFKNPLKSGSLAIGWTKACNDSGAVYGPGETPMLRDIIVPTSADIAGASMGMISPKDRIIDPSTIASGDAILMFESSGIHANGLTMARDLSDLEALCTQMDDGRMFGEAVLDPTLNYVPIIKAIQDAGIRPHYGINVTGHGWRKFMRAIAPFVYVIEAMPTLPEIFRFIQYRGNVTNLEMYRTYNMGVGFVLIMRSEDAAQAIAIAAAMDMKAWVGGYVEKRGEEKKVVIEPLGLVFEEDTLAVR